MVRWVRVHWMNPDWKSILKNEGPLPSWLLEIPVMDYDHPGKKPTNNQPTGVERSHCPNVMPNPVRRSTWSTSCAGALPANGRSRWWECHEAEATTASLQERSFMSRICVQLLEFKSSSLLPQQLLVKPQLQPPIFWLKFCINHVQVYLTWCFPCGSVANQLFSKLMMGCYQIELHQLSITSIPVPHQYIYLNVARMLWVLSVVSHISWDALITCETASEFPSKSMMQVPKTSTSAFAHCPNPLVGWVQWNFRPPLISGLFPLSQVPNTLSHKFGLVELAVTVSDQYIRSCLGSPWI